MTISKFISWKCTVSLWKKLLGAKDSPVADVYENGLSLRSAFPVSPTRSTAKMEAAARPPRSAALPGVMQGQPRTLGKYEIVKEIARGPLGIVYRAWDPILRRPAALKIITIGLLESPALLERWLHEEGLSGGALQHPNIVIIYELWEAHGTLIIAMELLEGESLNKMIERRAQLSIKQKIGFIVQVCRALEYAHGRGVVHRGIKPSNVMVTAAGQAKLVDFGSNPVLIAQLEQPIGNEICYIGPELILGKRFDARSDIWAAGTVFYELLAYQRPFTGETAATSMMNVLTQTPPPVSEAREDVPIEVDSIIGKMLQKDPERRYQSMKEVLADLEPIWNQLPFPS